MDTPQGLYSIPQSQQYLGGYSRSGLYELIAVGRLRAVKIGARTFIPRESLEEFVAQLSEVSGGVPAA